MGSARVQYELERTLPSLQLAATHGLFSKDVELRSVTQRRRQFENALVRRVAIASDFVQYIQFEEDLEKLRVLRVTRLKDVNKIPRSDMIKMQKEAIAHIVSIFERGVRRLRYDLDLWKYYIRWAHSRRMRVVVSRVSARALALFPNKVELWLLTANIELNDHQSASTSRALLQRGIRLNSISHNHSLQVQAESRPLKRTKKSSQNDESATKSNSLEIIPAGSDKLDRATLVLSEDEQDLVKLWLEYIRMELVFIERLRRRRMILGIHEEAGPVVEENAGEVEANLEDELATEQVPISGEGEVAPPSIESMQTAEGSTVQPSSALLQGAIVKASLLSAISLQSPTSLPPRAHFALLLAASQLYRSFPFCDDVQGLRGGLLSQVKSAIQSRFPTDPSAIILSSASELLDSSLGSSLSALSEMEIKEELQDGSLLKKASALSLHAQDYLTFEQMACKSGKEEMVDATVLDIISKSLLSLTQTTLVASEMKSIIETIRKQTLSLKDPTEIHFVAQLQLLRTLKRVVEERGLGKALDPYLDACSKRILQDAKAMSCEGAELEAEQCRGKLADAVKDLDEKEIERTKVVNVEQHIWKAHLQYPGNKDLLILYAHSILLCSQAQSLSQEEVVSRWHKIQKEKSGRDNAKIWEMWSRWMSESISGDDSKWKKSQMEASILQTLNAPAAHEQVLQAYMTQATSSSEATRRISFIERKAFPRPSLWRWMIDHSSRWGSEREVAELKKLLYQKLTQATSEVKDYRAYLAFLAMEVDESATALSVFQKAQTRVGKDARKRVALESAWQDICVRLRAQQERSKKEEETSDSEVDAEGESF